MKCPYCNEKAEWTENKAIYGKNYGKSYMVYLCKPCDAYVGCHLNSKRPLGTMANRDLREWRKRTHAVIDPIWKNGLLPRTKVYEILDKYFGFEVHVGESNEEMCKKIITNAKIMFEVLGISIPPPDYAV